MARMISDGGRESRTLPSRTAAATNVTVGNTSTPILAANTDRASAIVRVLSGSTIYISTGTPTTAASFPLSAGDVFQFSGSGALNGITASGTADVRVWEEED